MGSSVNFYTMIFKKITISVIILFSGCAGPSQFSTNDNWAESTLKRLTLREKIAQMMVYRMNMHYLNYNSEEWEEIKELISTDGIGILHIWFGETGSSLTMLNEMQRQSKVPILVEADIESGLGRRYPGAVTLPPMMAIAATGNPKFAYEAGRISAEESRAVGIHFNLAPVVDVNNNPKNPIINTRSFGEDPDSVNRYSKEFIRGLHDHGMLTTAKHFPGHGDTETDSHSALAQIPSDSSRLWNIELPPFKNAIDSGVDAIMVAHVNAPDFQLNPDDPATLSKFWIQDILRSKMQFDGVIITDAMDMGGIVKKYSDSYALIETIKAGSDIVIQNNQMKKSIDVVEGAVKDGILTEERINESALKVLKMKERLDLHKTNLITMDQTHNTIGSKSNFSTAEEIAKNSITLVKNENMLLPLQPDPSEEFYVVDLYDGPNNHNESNVTIKLREHGYKVNSFQIDKSDSLIIANHILEKRENQKSVQVKILQKKFADMPEGIKMLIPTPKTVDQFVKNIPTGVFLNLKSLRKELAHKYEAEMTCPIVTGISLRIISEAAFEEYEFHKDENLMTPFWRVVEPGSKLAEKLTCGINFIIEKQIMEGIER